MNKAVFIDRDGVINRKGKSYYIFREEEFIFNKGVFEALNYFQSKGYILIVITNQVGVAKGIYTVSQLEKLNKMLIDKLADQGIRITEIFYCPHHPDVSSCECRKPGSLLFEKAISKYEIDIKRSYMIGDTEVDIEAARKAGIKGFQIPTNGNMMTEIVEKELIK